MKIREQKAVIAVASASADLIDAYRLASATANRVRKRESGRPRPRSVTPKKTVGRVISARVRHGMDPDAALFERSPPRRDGERKAQNDQDRAQGYREVARSHLPGSPELKIASHRQEADSNRYG